VANVYRWELGGTTTTLGLNWMFTLHYQTAVGLDGLERPIADILRELEEAFSLTGQNLQHFTNPLRADNVFTFSRLREELEPGSPAIPDQALNLKSLPGGVGAVVGDKLPIEACVWVALRTGVASRSSRGGFHLPPVLDPAQLDGNGRWSSSLLASADMVTLAGKLNDTFTDVIGTLDLIPVVYSRTRRARGQEPWTFNIIDANFSSRVRWLRRRGTAP
jgi:hypothetical protein